jgi:hypothetical protein
MVQTVVSIFAEGSLVRSPTDLYRDYGVGRVVKVRGEQAKVEFNPSVFKPPPIFGPLPDAIQ